MTMPCIVTPPCDGWGRMGGGWAWFWRILMMLLVAALFAFGDLAPRSGGHGLAARPRRSHGRAWVGRGTSWQNGYARGEISTEEHHDRLTHR